MKRPHQDAGCCQNSALLGICQIAPGLWFGANQATSCWFDVLGITLVVLAAREIQSTVPPYVNVAVLSIPICDNEQALIDCERQILACVKVVVEHLRGRRGGVLVTCNAGMNRSALIAGLVLKQWQSMSGKTVVDLIQRQREGALTNSAFREALLSQTVWKGKR